MAKVKYPYMPKGKKILYVSEKNKFMVLARVRAEQSGCVKQATGAILVKNGKIIGQGTNAGRKLTVCPRVLRGSATGQDYHLCKENCAQEGHSEVMAVRDAKKNGHDFNGADLYLYGHWWCCHNCWDTMIEAGVKNVYLLKDSWRLFNSDVVSEMKKSENSVEKKYDQYKKIYTIFSKTKYGKKLAKKVRYERYKPKSVSKKLWENILGPDVNNLKHHLVTFNIAKLFFDDSKKQSGSYVFNPDEKKLLAIAALIHDWGEAITGDITTDLKSLSAEKKEITALESVIKDISINSPDVNFADLQGSFRKAIKGEDKKLFITFNAIERVGYLLTGVRAWKKSKLFVKNNKQFSNGLWWLSNNVALNQVEKLIEYSKSFSVVKFCLGENSKVIDEIFVKMPDEIFSNYEKKESIERRKQFSKAKKAWLLSKKKII
jgi:deoxycytidylate deaminase/5'-deoxynucleotidase YfbR-like HD superfamily hydrolase